jgi:putative NIF3 family GTP cyclohydrolase 1 type 2
MKLGDFRMYFIKQITPSWIKGNPEKNTADQIVYGDPNRDVKTCIVTWISSFVALRKAVERNFDLIVTHEPTFYGHSIKQIDNREVLFGEDKLQFIRDNNIAIMRLHDRWDIWPKYGIPWSWAEFLQLPGPPVAINKKNNPGTLHRYDIKPTTLEKFSNHFASRTSLLGEPHPIVVGDLDQIVSKVGIGTGCGCQVDGFRELGCDISIVCDDGSVYWRDIQRYEDEGHPIIRVNHGTSEEPGMKNLALFINKNFNSIYAEYLPIARKFHQI